MTLTLILGALLAVACVIVVSLPFLREPETKRDTLDERTEAERRRLALIEERDRALDALRELELDHRTGKISDDDHRALQRALRRQAAEALRALEGKSPAVRPIAASDSRRVS
jgi:hypothetical protein